MKYIAEEITKCSLRVVLKPHPLVSVGDYEAMFSRLKLDIPDNLEFSNLDAKELVKQSKVLVTNYSSLAIDARLEGKSVWSWLPTPTPDFMSLEWLNFVPKLPSRFNLLELDKEQDLPKLDAYIKQNYLLNRKTYKRRLKVLLNSLASKRVKRRFPVSQLRLMAYFMKLYVMGRLTLIPANRQQDFDAAHFLEELNMFEKYRASDDVYIIAEVGQTIKEALTSRNSISKPLLSWEQMLSSFKCVIMSIFFQMRHLSARMTMKIRLPKHMVHTEIS